MHSASDLSPLAKSEIQVGKPLPYSVYDKHGQLLLAAGQSVNSNRQLEELTQKGLYHNPRWSTGGYAIQNKSTMGTVVPSTEKRTQSTAQTFSRTVGGLEDPTETGYQLKMNVLGSPDQFEVKLVGVLGKEAFVISHPKLAGQCIFVKEGQTWEFRSFYGLSVYRFKSMVDKVLLAPHQLLVMSWPHDSNLETRVIRQARRISCEVPCVVRKIQTATQAATLIAMLGDEESEAEAIPSGPEEVESFRGIVHNISTGGVEFELMSGKSLSSGERVVLVFQLAVASRKYLLELSAKVVSASVNEYQQRRYGMAFDTLNDQTFSVVHAYVCDRLVQKLESPLYVR